MDTCCSRRPQKYPAAGRDPGGTTTGPPLPRHHLRGHRNPPDRGPGRGVPLASEGLQARSWGHQGRGTWGQRDSRGQRGGGRAGPPPRAAWQPAVPGTAGAGLATGQPVPVPRTASPCPLPGRGCPCRTRVCAGGGQGVTPEPGPSAVPTPCCPHKPGWDTHRECVWGGGGGNGPKITLQQHSWGQATSGRDRGHLQPGPGQPGWDRGWGQGGGEEDEDRGWGPGWAMGTG